MASHTAHPALHTAEHILTQLLHERFPLLTNFNTRLKSRKCVVTFDYAGVLTDDDRVWLEQEMQTISLAAMPVIEGTMPRVEAERRLPNLYQVPSDADPVRVIRIAREERVVDERACVGTHVANTAEIQNPRLPTLREEEPGCWRINLVVD